MQKNLIEEVQSWEGYLKENPRNFLKIGFGPGDRLRFLEAGNQKNRYYIQWSDIERAHTSLMDWLDGKIIEHSLDEVSVFFKKTNGSSSVHGPRGREDFRLGNRLGKLRSDNGTPTTAQQQSNKNPMESNNHNNGQQQVHYPPPAPYPPNGLGAAAMQVGGNVMAAAQAAGMGFMDFVKLQKNNDLYEIMKADHAKLKEELHALTLKNRELESKVEIAERAEKLAIQEAVLNKSSFMESPGMQKLMETMAPTLATMASGGRSGQQQAGMGAPVQNVTGAKKRFIDLIVDESFDERYIPVLEQIVVAYMTSKKEFINEMIDLIKKHSDNGIEGQ